MHLYRHHLENNLCFTRGVFGWVNLQQAHSAEPTNTHLTHPQLGACSCADQEIFLGITSPPPLASIPQEAKNFVVKKHFNSIEPSQRHYHHKSKQNWWFLPKVHPAVTFWNLSGMFIIHFETQCTIISCSLSKKHRVWGMWESPRLFNPAQCISVGVEVSWSLHFIHRNLYHNIVENVY